MATDIFKSEDANIHAEIDKIAILKNNTIEICHMMNCDMSKFNLKDTIKKVEIIVSEGSRFFYSEISNFIYGLDEYSRPSFYNNLNILVDEALRMDEGYENVKRAIIKLFDHANLAAKQYDKLKWTDEEFTRMFNMNIWSVKEDIERHKKETTSQLISLVAIFTAMSFLVFGGINSLDNIFAGLLDVSILKLMMVGCIWGICMLNLVFVFVYFIAKVSGSDIKTNHSVDANFIQRYPFTCWSNLVVFTLFLLCGWLYYIDTQSIKEWLTDLSITNQNIVYVIGFALIGLLFILLARYIIKKCNES